MTNTTTKPKRTLTVLPRPQVRLRVTHGNDPSDDSLERVSLRDRWTGSVVSRIWLPAEEIDDDFWWQPRRRGGF